MRILINILVTLAVMVGVWAECANLKVFAGENWTKSTYELQSKIVRL